MKPLWNHRGGQCLAESVLLLPMLLVLLAVGYWTFRHFAFSGSAESAAHARLLRTGRKLASIDSSLSRTIHPGNGTVRFREADAPPAGRIPMFRGMAGTTVCSADVSIPPEPIGAFLELPSHAVRREAEGAVDCWGRNTKSGTTIRRTVQAASLKGVVR